MSTPSSKSNPKNNKSMKKSLKKVVKQERKIVKLVTGKNMKHKHNHKTSPRRLDGRILMANRRHHHNGGEFLSTVTASGSATVTQICYCTVKTDAVFAGLPSMLQSNTKLFPQASTIASLYQYAQIRKLRLIYESELGAVTSPVGSIYMCWLPDADAVDKRPVTAFDIANCTVSASANCAQRCELIVPQRELRKFANGVRFQNSMSGNQTDTSSNGIFFVGIVSGLGATTAVQVGRLFVEYEIEFSDLRLQSGSLSSFSRVYASAKLKKPFTSTSDFSSTYALPHAREIDSSRVSYVGTAGAFSNSIGGIPGPEVTPSWRRKYFMGIHYLLPFESRGILDISLNVNLLRSLQFDAGTGALDMEIVPACYRPLAPGLWAAMPMYFPNHSTFRGTSPNVVTSSSVNTPVTIFNNNNTQTNPLSPPSLYTRTQTGQFHGNYHFFVDTSSHPKIDSEQYSKFAPDTIPICIGAWVNLAQASNVTLLGYENFFELQIRSANVQSLLDLGPARNVPSFQYTSATDPIPTNAGSPTQSIPSGYNTGSPGLVNKNQDPAVTAELMGEIYTYALGPPIEISGTGNDPLVNVHASPACFSRLIYSSPTPVYNSSNTLPASSDDGSIEASGSLTRRNSGSHDDDFEHVQDLSQSTIIRALRNLTTKTG